MDTSNDITQTCPCITCMQRFLNDVKMIILVQFFFYIFLIFAQNIDCRYSLDETLRGVEIFVIDLHKSYVISSYISIILAKDLS